jgi:hypothetical protein
MQSRSMDIVIREDYYEEATQMPSCSGNGSWVRRSFVHLRMRSLQ